MSISLSQLQTVFTANKSGCAKYIDAINSACEKYNITSPLRIAAFIAQIGHESCQLFYVREIWGPTKAQLGYEGRADLGNTCRGDGKWFMGRGFIQITGRANYTQLAADLGIDCVNHPELLEQPQYAAMSAGWFWDQKGLNALADQKQFITITKRINGGTNGLEDRQLLYNRALAMFENQGEE